MVWNCILNNNNNGIIWLDMARIYPRGKILWIQYSINGERFRESLGLQDNRENRILARKILKQKEAEILTGIHPVIKKITRKNLEQCCKEFINEKKELGRTEKTIKNYKYAYNKLLKYTGDVELKKIDSTVIKEFENSIKLSEKKDKEGKRKKNSENTIEIIFRHLRIIFEYFRKKKYITDNPIPKKTATPKKIKTIPEKTVEEILEKLRKHNLNQYRAIKLMLMTGLRVGELCMAEYEDIDYENEIFYIRNNKGKRVDSFPLYEELKKFIMTEFPSAGGKIVPYKNGESFKFFSKFLKKEGYEHYTIHELRKTFISDLVNTGEFDIFEIQEIARHKDIRTTKKSYIRMDIKRIGAKINKVKKGTLKGTETLKERKN